MKRMISWIPAVMWMGLIFFFSTDVFAYQSTGSIFKQLMHSLFPTLGTEAIELLHISLRKSAHVSAYFVLSFWVTWGFLGGNRFKNWSLRLGLLSLGFCIVYALSDEWHQSFSVHRTASLGDVAWDTLGATLMQSLAWGRRRYQQDENHPQETENKP